MPYQITSRAPQLDRSVTFQHFPPSVSPSDEEKECYAGKQQGPQRRTNPNAYGCTGADPATTPICIAFRAWCWVSAARCYRAGGCDSFRCCGRSLR